MLSSRLFASILNKPCIRPTNFKSKFLLPFCGNQIRLMSKHKDEMKEYLIARIGNREIVGYGFNGQPCYVDRPDYPFPAIRYGEPTADIIAIRQKEKGDWRLLTIEEKKKLYRYSYCQTFSEFLAFTSEWMAIIGYVLILVDISLWVYIYQRFFVYDELPDSFFENAQLEQLRRQLDLKVNPITGLSADYDFEKKEWKRHSWFYKRPNPFEADEECEE